MSRQFHIVVKRGGIDPPARQFLDRQRNPKRRAVKPFDFVHLTFGKADALAHFQQGQGQLRAQARNSQPGRPRQTRRVG